MTNWVNETVDQPVVFAGATDLGELPVSAVREGLPRAVATLTPTHWIVADPWSFPIEHLRDRQLDAPIDVILPSRTPHEGFYRTMDHALLRELGPFDSIACSAELWERFAPSHHWSASQWVHQSRRVEETTRYLLRRARTSTRLSQELDAAHLTDWNVRTRSNKARYRAELTHLVPLIKDAARHIAPGTEARVVELGSDVGRYVGILRSEGYRITSLRMTEGSAAQLRFNHPDLDIISVGSGVATTQAPESVDLVVSSLDYHSLPEGVRERLLRRVLGSLRVGGTLLGIHRLDVGSKATLSQNLSALLEAGGSHLVRESLASVKNPDTGRTDTAIVSFTKIGVPREW